MSIKHIDYVLCRIILRCYTRFLGFGICILYTYSASLQAIGLLQPMINDAAPNNSSALPLNLQPGCTGNIADFVQITTASLDAGVHTFDALRIMRDGTVEWASWNSFGYLLSHAEPQKLEPEIFDRAVTYKDSLVARTAWFKLGISEPGPIFHLEMCVVLDGKMRISASTALPNDLSKLLKDIRGRMPASKVYPGKYIWTQPYNAPEEKADMDLTQADCGSTIAKALSQAASGRLVIKADDDLSAFGTEENVYRGAFIAKYANGQLLFGILSTK